MASASGKVSCARAWELGRRTKGEVDIAFRSGDTDDELIGRKIADSFWAVYASPDYIERHGKPDRVEDLSQHLLIGFDETLAGHRAAKWLKDVAPEARMPVRNNSVLGPVPELTRSWRLLTHPDIRRVPRIAAFFDYIIEQREALKSILTG